MHEEFHWHDELQVLAMQAPGQPDAVVLPGEQTPCPMHAPHASQTQVAAQERVWVPQYPQDWDWLWPGLQVPCPAHPLQTLQLQLPVQLRDWVPHLPQA